MGCVKKDGKRSSRWHQLSSFIFALSTLILVNSCSEVLYLSVEQMVPPEIMPNHAASSVGVINNFSKNNVVIVNEDALIIPCDADSVKEQIAIGFSNGGMLERVVVFDSLLYHPDSVTPHVLAQSEINAICDRLEVDMLYSIDYACVAINQAPRYVGRPMNAYLCSRIYTPDKDSISGSATMDKRMLESWIYDTVYVDEMIREVPSQLAEMAVEPYFPTWKKRERVFYYDRLNFALREAKVYVGEANWEAAAEQWKDLSSSKLRVYRFMAAFNMALYYEMKDSVEKAIAQLDAAKELAITKDRHGNNVLLIDTTLVDEYREVLVNRNKEIVKLDAYLRKFED